jgi:two-component system, NtrC family, sensor kinase
MRREGDSYHGAAYYNVSSELIDFIKRHPITPGRHSITGRVALERRTIHVADLQADPEYRYVLRDTDPIGTELGVPMFRGDDIVGVIILHKLEVQPFTAKQIELVETFADQAVIAIENVRLFNETREALEQQTATSEILRAISSSPADLQPVLDAVAERAARLCSADDVKIHLVDGDTLRLAAQRGPIPSVQTRPIIPTRLTGRTVLERRTIHVHDMRAALDEFPDAAADVLGHGVRTSLSTPLRREDVAIGVIQMRRLEVAPFSEKEIALLQTFADQAVIAIENVRLFTETKEALERQTATSEILRVISSSPTDTQPVFDIIAANAARLCAARDAQVLQVEGDVLRLVSAYGSPSMPPVRTISRGHAVGRAVIDRQTIHVRDMAQAIAEFPETSAPQHGVESVLAVPLLREDVAVGVIRISRTQRQPFTDQQIALMETFADQAVIAIENVRLFKELQEKNRALSESLEQQTATSEILGVISGSPTDIQPVLDAITASATRLCEASEALIRLVDGDMMRVVAHLGSVPIVESAIAQPISRGSVGGRVILERRTAHIHDVLNPDVGKEYPTGLWTLFSEVPYRTLLVVPLVREDRAIGTIAIRRPEVRPFSNKQVELLQTFADQAVIAIENVRLFTELEASNREIAEKSRQIEVASQHKSEFLANMSHELRTPLNAIIGFSEVLSERMFGELNEKQEEYSKDIHASGQHLLSLINDILDLSKIEAGRMELELTDFHLPTALDNALTLVRERAGRRSITLQMSVDERLGEVRADERKIRQVVLNLLSNAIKFTPEGGRIEVAAVPRDGSVEVSVSDTGVGIAPEDLEAVFEEFRQVGTAEKKAEGTGLGLTLCRKFIELHGGRISVKSQVGVGSTFTFTIPVRPGE